MRGLIVALAVLAVGVLFGLAVSAAPAHAGCLTGPVVGKAIKPLANKAWSRADGPLKVQVRKYKRLRAKTCTPVQRAKARRMWNAARRRLASVRREKRCWRSSRPVGASVYGAWGDDNGRGYRGDHLASAGYSYAELGMGTLLGGLPYRHKLWIWHNGRSVFARKLDIGAGGGPVHGMVRRIDLHYKTARAIGFDWYGTAIVWIATC